MVKTVFGILPAFVNYSDKGMAEWQGGYAKGPYIQLREKYRTDEGILQHELTHVKQFYSTILIGLLIALVCYLIGFEFIASLMIGGSFGIHAFLYLFVQKYRLWCEVSAYRVQNKYYEDDRSIRFAKVILEKYSITGIDLDSVIQMLRK